MGKESHYIPQREVDFYFLFLIGEMKDRKFIFGFISGILIFSIYHKITEKNCIENIKNFLNKFIQQEVYGLGIGKLHSYSISCSDNAIWLRKDLELVKVWKLHTTDNFKLREELRDFCKELFKTESKKIGVFFKIDTDERFLSYNLTVTRLR